MLGPARCLEMRSTTFTEYLLVKPLLPSVSLSTHSKGHLNNICHFYKLEITSSDKISNNNPPSPFSLLSTYDTYR